MYKEYKTTGQVPIIGVDNRKTKKEILDEWKDIILKEYEAFRLNALYMEKTIYARHKIRIPHNTIHKVMLEHNLSKQEKKVEWYNNRPHGSLNLRGAETPNEAFIRKMRPEVWFGFAVKSFGW